MESFFRVFGSLIGGLILAALLAVGIGVYYLFVYGTGLAETNRRDNEGGEYGKKTDNPGCLQESLSKITNQETVTEIIANNVFLASCLKASRPTAGFCDGVPKRADRTRSMEWAGRQCAAANRSGRACLAAMQIVQSYCESPNFRPGPNSPFPAGVDPPEDEHGADPAPPENQDPPEVDPKDDENQRDRDPRDRDDRDPDSRDSRSRDRDRRDEDPKERDRDDRDSRDREGDRDRDRRRNDRDSDDRDRDPDRRRDDRDSKDQDRGYSESTDHKEHKEHKKRRRFPWL